MEGISLYRADSTLDFFFLKKLATELSATVMHKQL